MPPRCRSRRTLCVRIRPELPDPSTPKLGDTAIPIVLIALHDHWKAVREENPQPHEQHVRVHVRESHWPLGGAQLDSAQTLLEMVLEMVLEMAFEMPSNGPDREPSRPLTCDRHVHHLHLRCRNERFGVALIGSGRRSWTAPPTIWSRPDRIGTLPPSRHHQGATALSPAAVAAPKAIMRARIPPGGGHRRPVRKVVRQMSPTASRALQ
jgi:hypothetical protein